MKLSRPGLLGILMLLATPAPAIDRLPVEDFSREPSTSHARLSPDGKRLAFIREHREHATLFITDIDKGKLSRLDLGGVMDRNTSNKEVGEFQWISAERLLITTTIWDLMYGVIAVDWDGGGSVPISGYEDNQVAISGTKIFANEVIHNFHDKDQNILMLDRHALGRDGRSYPDILRVNTLTGVSSRNVQNPGNVVHWGLDADGVARLGITVQEKLTGAIYRENDQAPWRTVLPLQNRTDTMQPLGFDASSNRMFVTALTPDKRWTVCPLDPATGELGEPLLTDPEYDIVPKAFAPNVDGIALAGPKFSREKKSLTGIRYYTEVPQVKWFDKTLAAHQASIDRAMPVTTNVLASTSQDEKRLLWYCYSDRNPGEYYLMDVEKHSLKLLATHMSWIKPNQMAHMLGVKYPARDGLVIHGYLTIPAGHQPKGLPLVVLPHGGPWVRDLWGFNPLVQLLANRGYAVLQMNYRGSPGYGDELYRTARRQIGRKIQDDIEDATRWAITAGIADPQRIAIMGQSYGGYSALFALGHNPELYRCGISIAGVTDWLAMFDNSDVGDYKAASRHWREQMGDPDKDKDFLQAVSPVNFADKITAPVLIIQGKEDHRVPQDQAKRMIAALEKTGGKPASLFLSEVGHNYGSEKKRLEIYKSIVAFLEKNLGPGVP